MLAQHKAVLVRRDMAEVIHTTVFDHELEILRDMHGEGNVEVLDTEFEPIELDAGEEFDRLVNVYGRNDEGQIYAERCIGRGPKQLESLGVQTAKRGRQAKEAE